MPPPVFWLDESLLGRVLAPFLRPVLEQMGWELRQQRDLTAMTVRRFPGLALLDTIEALALVPAYALATDLALVAQHASVVALETPDRPDRIGEAVVVSEGCRPASRALARATIEPFFGLRIRAWDGEQGADALPVLRVHEDEAALGPLGERSHDLGRAWFVLTGQPFVSQLLVVAPELPSDVLRPVASLLQVLPEQLAGRAAEIAAELVAARPLDAGRLRVVLTEALSVVTPKVRKAVDELVRRSGSGLRLPPGEIYRPLAS